MGTGWAYVDCSSGAGGGQAAGPTGSIQFLTGTNATSGSANLLYYTASYAGLPPNSIVLSGNLVITGTISASVYNYRDIQVIDATGSTRFGDSNDDRHIRTGSFHVGTASGVPQFEVQATSSQFRGTVQYLYEPVTVTSYTAEPPSYILGVSNTSDVTITIPSASRYGPGSIILIKDEASSRTPGTSITLTANTGYTIDGSQTYVLTGTMPAISLYSNGSNWFVF